MLEQVSECPSFLRRIFHCTDRPHLAYPSIHGHLSCGTFQLLWTVLLCTMGHEYLFTHLSIWTRPLHRLLGELAVILAMCPGLRLHTHVRIQGASTSHKHLPLTSYWPRSKCSAEAVPAGAQLPGESQAPLFPPTPHLGSILNLANVPVFSILKIFAFSIFLGLERSLSWDFKFSI